MKTELSCKLRQELACHLLYMYLLSDIQLNSSIDCIVCIQSPVTLPHVPHEHRVRRAAQPVPDQGASVGPGLARVFRSLRCRCVGAHRPARPRQHPYRHPVGCTPLLSPPRPLIDRPITHLSSSSYIVHYHDHRHHYHHHHHHHRLLWPFICHHSTVYYLFCYVYFCQISSSCVKF